MERGDRMCRTFRSIVQAGFRGRYANSSSRLGVHVDGAGRVLV